MIGMVKNYAKFTAEIQKGINIKGSDVEMKLLIPLKAAQPYLNFLSNSQGNEVNIFVGDPQMAFDFDEDEDDAYKIYQGGRRVNTDASGVVTAVEQPDEQKDENQAELDLEGSGLGDENEQTDGGQSEESEGDQPPAEDNDELNDYEKEIMGEGSTPKDSDLPEWMQEQQQEQSGGQEMSFEDSGQEPAADGNTDTEGTQASSDEEISKEELEQFILKERPSFEDIPLDFPLFLEKRLIEGKTWVEISKIAGIPSSQIQPKWKKYKEMVTKMMRDGGAA